MPSLNRFIVPFCSGCYIALLEINDWQGSTYVLFCMDSALFLTTNQRYAEVLLDHLNVLFGSLCWYLIIIYFFFFARVKNLLPN